MVHSPADQLLVSYPMLSAIKRWGSVERDPLYSATDAELVSALSASNPRAKAILWDRYAPRTKSLLRRILGPDADVDDCLHDVFEAVFVRIGTLRDPEALRHFITSVAMRKAISEVRRKRRFRWLGLEKHDPPDPTSLESTTSARALLRAIYGVLDSFPPRVRAAFILRYVEGQGLTEIADALGTSATTTKRDIAHGLELFTTGAGQSAELSRVDLDGLLRRRRA
ncbi:MAG: hypothetical protein RJA70_3792 [Pseudomonadota bacterium]|jgi:RNA polymerase sigma-70 factor (ECF subfamily)